MDEYMDVQSSMDGYMDVQSMDGCISIHPWVFSPFFGGFLPCIWWFLPFFGGFNPVFGLIWPYLALFGHILDQNQEKPLKWPVWPPHRGLAQITERKSLNLAKFSDFSHILTEMAKIPALARVF